MAPLQLAGDRLDQGVLLERLDDSLARHPDELGKFLGGVLALGGENGIGEEVGGSLMELVEEEWHGGDR